MERDVPVREVMDREYVGVSESDGVRETAELLLAEGAEAAVVLRGSDPVGVVTERDALAALVDDGAATAAADAMTEVAPTVHPDASIGEVADRMSRASTTHAVVSDGDETVGVVTEHDLITTAPFAPATTTPRSGERAAATVGETDRAAVATTETNDQSEERAYEEQSICEACGSLSRDLTPFNGQLLCADCRDI